MFLGTISPRQRRVSPRQTRGPTCFLGSALHLRLCEGGLHLGGLGASYKHCFPTVLYIVQAGSWGGAPHVKGTLSVFFFFVNLWILVNGT